jgi:hypothetical protein
MLTGSFAANTYAMPRMTRDIDIVIALQDPGDLVVSKLNWARDFFSEVQLNDVRSIMKTVENLDKPYIEGWVQRLGLSVVYSRAKS